ncbi:MAG: alpha-ribazole phosphatase family protein [Betaproteobacteria bacterium]|nr:alpha-ribazole phosphatase family protein [Betaproteobacteria bacterium]
MSGRTHIDLLRHGETLAGSVYLGRSDALLSEHGYRQMAEALLNAPRYHAVLSSPLARCAAFAQDYAQQHGLPLYHDARFQEMDFGAWDGRSAAEIAATDASALENFWRDPVACPPPQAEPLLSFQARVLAAWQELPTRYSGQRVLLITHGGVMRIILCRLQQRPLTELLSLPVPHAALHQIIVEHKPQQTGQVPA